GEVDEDREVGLENLGLEVAVVELMHVLVGHGASPARARDGPETGRRPWNGPEALERAGSIGTRPNVSHRGGARQAQGMEALPLRQGFLLDPPGERPADEITQRHLQRLRIRGAPSTIPGSAGFVGFYEAEETWRQTARALVSPLGRTVTAASLTEAFAKLT